jgi:hypothetical protein
MRSARDSRVRSTLISGGDMIGKAELLRWVNSLSDESCIGVDEGGLCLREVGPDDRMTEAYFEIGGVPEYEGEGGT